MSKIASLKVYAEFCDVEFRSILKHGETRWLSLHCSIKHTIYMWEHLQFYFDSLPEVEKAGKVKVNILFS